MGLIQKIFGTYSQRELKSIYPIADKIEALEDEYRQLTDEQLQAKTPESAQPRFWDCCDKEWLYHYQCACGGIFQRLQCFGHSA